MYIFLLLKVHINLVNHFNYYFVQVKRAGLCVVKVSILGSQHQLLMYNQYRCFFVIVYDKVRAFLRHLRNALEKYTTELPLKLSKPHTV